MKMFVTLEWFKNHFSLYENLVLILYEGSSKAARNTFVFHPSHLPQEKRRRHMRCRWHF